MPPVFTTLVVSRVCVMFGNGTNFARMNWERKLYDWLSKKREHEVIVKPCRNRWNIDSRFANYGERTTDER